VEFMGKMDNGQLDTRDKTLVIGMGKTGLSCVRFLRAQGVDVMAYDNRLRPPALAEMQQMLAPGAIQCGGFDAEAFSRCRQLVVSPGVPVQDAAIQVAQARGVEIVGDIELFARHTNVPVIAITGSNGKSTVTALLGEMLKRAGFEVRIGGNFGTPALDLLAGSRPDVYVLELSSFQLETTSSLNAVASVILNVSPDHMDRYDNDSDYLAAKQRIWAGDGVVVVNRDEAGVLTGSNDLGDGRRQLGFTLAEPNGRDYGLCVHDGKEWLAQGKDPLLPVTALRLVGRHNIANALAALALAEVLIEVLSGSSDVSLGTLRPALLQALSDFRGLPHRMEWLAEVDGVNWYNDSKGTNVGATLAALQGLDSPVILIAGGIAKDADFSLLAPVMLTRGRAVILIGRDAAQIERALAGVVPCFHAADMDQAVSLAATQARSGDVVLLSPACASFDMYDGYEHRGKVFASAVARIAS